MGEKEYVLGLSGFEFIEERQAWVLGLSGNPLKRAVLLFLIFIFFPHKHELSLVLMKKTLGVCMSYNKGI